MKPVLATLSALAFATPLAAQDAEGETTAPAVEQGAVPDSPESGLSLRGDDGENVVVDEANDPPAEDAEDGMADAAAEADSGTADTDEPMAPADGAMAGDGSDDASASDDPPETEPAEAAADDDTAPAAPPEDGAMTADDASNETSRESLPADPAPETDGEPASETPEGPAASDSATGSDETTPEEDAAPDAAAEPQATDEAAAEPQDADEAAEPADSAEAAPGLSAPFLSSTDYAAQRPASTDEPIRLVWQVETFTPDGERRGDAETRTLILAPDFVRYERGNAVEIYDFAFNRHLELDLAAGTLTNTAFEAEVRRRLDTYLGLSQAGRLDQIPLGPDRSFDRFWLEAAMGIRREPVAMDVEFAEAMLTVESGEGPTLLTARFDIAAAEPPDEAPEADAPAASEEDTESSESAADRIALMATPIDLSSGESVVFDPSEAAAAITLDSEASSQTYPSAPPELQAQAELFRRWMRHALPVHPDVLATLRGAPGIPEQFAYFIVSPDSPDGRREMWTLQSADAVEAGFRLEPDLVARVRGPGLLQTVLLPVAAAVAGDAAPDETALIEAITAYRDAGDLARAYLVAFHETSRNGPCPSPGQASRRPVCGEVSGIVAAGLGDAAFETVFEAVNQVGGEDGESIFAAISPYLETDGFVGAAARTIVANELIAWAARDPEGPPAEIDPYILLAEAIAMDPHAGANYRYLGNALLSLRNPLGAWTAYDAGRAVPGAAANGLLVQISVLEDRLRGLAPDFFLPR